MSLFSNQRFLLKVHAEPFEFDIPRSEEEYKFLTPTFKFFSSHQKGFQLEQSEELIKLQVGELSLKGFQLSWNTQTKKLRIQTDELSLYPLIALPASDGGLWLANTTAFFPRVEKNYRLDPLAIQQFFTRRFLLPGQFFIEGARRIAGRWEATLPSFSLPRPQDCYWQADFAAPHTSLKPQEVVTLLRSTLESILHLAQPTEFRMSGGADSRLISLLFNKGEQRGLIFRTAFASWADPTTDLDYQVARRWCDHQSWQLRTQEFSKRHSSIFDGADGQCLLSGLYGGEFLGGMWEKMINSPWDQPQIQHSLSSYGEELTREETARLMELSATAREMLGKQVFTHCDRSFIYENVRSGWVSPLANFRVATSPFAVLPYLKTFLRIPQEDLRDYKLYREVLKTLEGQDRHFPVCSLLTQYDPSWQAPESWGREAKSQIASRSWDRETFQQAMEEVFEDLHQRGVEVSEERFREQLSDSALFRRLATNLFYAFPRKIAP